MRHLPHLFAAVLIAGTAPAGAAEPPPRQPGGIATAPAALRPYLEAARKADALPGRDERCQAYPDLPGNRWPAGLAQEWCREYDLVTLDAVRAHLERGDLAGLDAAYKRHLDLHFKDAGFSEIIHNDFLVFENTGDTTADVTARWLAKAPKSPYANAARATHLLQMAWKARGAGYISESSKEQLREMERLTAQAAQLFATALELEPRLLPAHEELIEIGMMNSEDKLVDEVYRRASALDGACRRVTHVKMRSLQPKWGGSYAQMAQYARTLEPLQARRPLLANTVVMPEMERAAELYEAKQYQQVVEVLKPAALKANFPFMLARLGRSLIRLDKGEPWDALVYLLQSGRFEDSDFDADSDLAWALGKVGELEWSIKYAKRALAVQPDNAWVNLYLGDAYLASRRAAEAEPYFLTAMKDESKRVQALEKLAWGMSQGGRWDKAEVYGEQLSREQPDNGWGWYTLGMARIRLGKHDAVLAPLETYLKVADRADPQHAAMSADVEKMVTRFKTSRAERDARERSSQR
jgi:tetratricopeptide (TPR) repeat protein